MISFTSIFEAVGIASASFTLIFSRNKKKKHDKILMLARSKLNSIETLISQSLTDMEISHEELVTILNEKDKYEKMKDNLSSEMKNIKL